MPELTSTADLILQKLQAGKNVSPAELAVLREAGAVDPTDRVTFDDLGTFLISGGSVRGRRLTVVAFCVEAGIDPESFDDAAKEEKAVLVGQIIDDTVRPNHPAIPLAWPMARDYYSIELALAELNSRLQNPAALDAKAATDACNQVDRLVGKRAPIVAQLRRMFGG